MGTFWKTDAPTRKKMIDLYFRGYPLRGIATRFGCSPSYVQKLAKKVQEGYIERDGRYVKDREPSDRHLEVDRRE